MANPFDDDTPKVKKIVDEILPPIFSKQKIQFSPPEEIRSVCVCNDLLVIAMNKNKLLRIDLIKPDLTDEIEVTKTMDDSIFNIFMDSFGRHMIISMSSGDNYYLPRNAKKPKPLMKCKGHLITSIGWNIKLETETNTSFILVGTNKGFIFEAELSINDEKIFFTQGPDIHFKQLFCFGKEKAQPITGIVFDCLSSISKSSKRYFIIVTQLGRLYQLIGNISFESPFFHPIFAMHDDLNDRFMDLPESSCFSDLKLFYPSVEADPQHFGMMTSGGLYFCGINTNPPEGADAVSLNSRLIPFPIIDDVQLKNPISFLLTEFHILVLFSDKFVIMNILNEEVVQIDNFNQTYGKLRNSWYDPIRGSIWVASTNSVFRYKVFKENRDTLKIYINQNEFEMAKKYSKGDSELLNLVRIKEANYLYSLNRFKESAKIYSETNASFEDIALKFSLLEDKESLRIFLFNKLLLLTSQDKTQRTMIVLWLCEIWLNELGVLKDNSKSDVLDDDFYLKLLESFRSFLSTPSIKDCLIANKQVIYDLINCHGDSTDVIWFANLVADYEMMTMHNIQKEDYKAALQILTQQIKNTSLLYKFSPLLILHTPRDLINVWLKNSEYLLCEKFIPSLIKYDQLHRNDKPNEAIRYLEFCTNTIKVKTKAIHNYLIAMYVKLQMFDELLFYLNEQGQEADQVMYDLEYALRLCIESGDKRSCVHIYTTMQFYEQAVDLALQFDLDLARSTANKPSEDLELKRKLWLQIARHVVEKEKDIKKAMEFLKDGNFIRIEDILPFFPEFVTIDHFKDAICSSLQQYNDNLENLRRDMNEATENAEVIRKRIQAVREQCSFVKSEEKCCCCSHTLMMRSFYLFPCSHNFHTDCFIAEVMPYLDRNTRNKIKELEDKINSLNKSASNQTTNQSNKIMEKSAAELYESLDELVAKECVYCGEIMINSIDQPFVNDADLQNVINSWL